MSNTEQLKVRIEDYQEILQCKRRINVLKKELHLQKLRLNKLKSIVDKEHQDVLNLEQTSLKNLFSSLLLNKEAQLEKERQEYLLAALNLNESQNLIELLEYEKKILLKKLKSEMTVTKKLEEALDDFQINKNKEASEEIILLKSLNDEIKNLIKLKTESQEAYEVIKELKISFKQILEALEKAAIYDNWGFSYKEIQVGKTKQKQYIDKAQAQVYTIRKQLIFLRSELLDIEQFKNLFKEAKDLIQNFNLHYYNDLISDWINLLKLNETLEHTISTFDTINKIGKQLRSLIKTSDQEYQILLVKRETLIEMIAG